MNLTLAHVARVDVQDVMQAETRTLMGNIGWLYLRPSTFLSRMPLSFEADLSTYPGLVGHRGEPLVPQRLSLSCRDQASLWFIRRLSSVADLGIDYHAHNSSAKLNSTSFFVIREMTFRVHVRAEREREKYSNADRRVKG